MRIRVGLAQIAPSLGDFDGNMQLHLATIETARREGVALLIFPELSLTGYHLREQAFDLAISTASDAPALAPLLAASIDLDLVVSFVEIGERSRYYISAAYLSQGTITHVHRKVYLPTYGLFDEGRYFGPGHEIRAFDTRFGRVGLLICEDFWHLSLPYLLWLDGADLFIFTSASVEHGLIETGVETAGRVNGMLQSYAGLLTSFVVHTNRAGTEEGLDFWGSSAVFGPDGRQLAAGLPMQSQLLITTIDMSDLRTARTALPLLRDERPLWTLHQLERIVRKDDER